MIEFGAALSGSFCSNRGGFPQHGSFGAAPRVVRKQPSSGAAHGGIRLFLPGHSARQPARSGRRTGPIHPRKAFFRRKSFDTVFRGQL